MHQTAAHLQRDCGHLLPPSVAGRIHIRSTTDSKIQIPLFYVGKPLSLGAILAHELSHQLLAVRGHWFADELENERLTDAASIAAGLGKLVLNGTITEMAQGTGELQLLGYLEPRVKARLYLKLNAYHGIPATISRKNLTESATNLLA